MSYITLLIYPLMLALIFVGSKWEKRKEFNENWSSISQSKALQGIAAVCIVCHHTAQQTCVEWLESGNIVHGLDLFSRVGFLFVSVFFFWSGYGLYKSLKSKPNYLDNFIAKRIVPIWVPYVIVCFLFTFVRIFIQKEKMWWPYLFTNLTGITIGYYFGWYIQAIIVYYFIFYFAFKFCKSEKIATLIIWLGVLAWVVAGVFIDHNIWVFRGEWWYNSVLIFPFGITFAQNEEKIIKSFKKRYAIWLVASILLSLFFLFFSFYKEATAGFYGEYMHISVMKKVGMRVETFLPQLVSAAFFVLMNVLFSLKVTLKNKVLTFCGNHTLEIYLTHAFFLETLALLYNWHRKSIFYGRPWILLVATIVPTIPAAIGLKKLSTWIIKKYNRTY